MRKTTGLSILVTHAIPVGFPGHDPVGLAIGSEIRLAFREGRHDLRHPAVHVLAIVLVHAAVIVEDSELLRPSPLVPAAPAVIGLLQRKQGVSLIRVEEGAVLETPGSPQDARRVILGFPRPLHVVRVESRRHRVSAGIHPVVSERTTRRGFMLRVADADHRHIGVKNVRMLRFVPTQFPELLEVILIRRRPVIIIATQTFALPHPGFRVLVPAKELVELVDLTALIRPVGKIAVLHAVHGVRLRPLVRSQRKRHDSRLTGQPGQVHRIQNLLPVLPVGIRIQRRLIRRLSRRLGRRFRSWVSRRRNG